MTMMMMMMTMIIAMMMTMAMMRRSVGNEDSIKACHMFWSFTYESFAALKILPCIFQSLNFFD